MEMSGLHLRVLSASILLGAAYGLLFVVPVLWFEVLSGLWMIGLAFEWSRLCGCRSQLFSLLYGAGIVVVAYTVPDAQMHRLFLYGCGAWLVACMMLGAFLCNKHTKLIAHRSLGHCLGWFILLASYKALVLFYLYHLEWLILLMAMVIAVDVGGYFFGSYFGKDPFFQAISPAKTWQGAFGGGGCALVIMLLAWWGNLFSFSCSFLAFCTLSIIIAAMMGDLFASMLKRLAGVKDTGRLIPGHGGLLDRFDSLIAVLPIAGCLFL
jgi:phosphatidate cytidylyltransferase